MEIPLDGNDASEILINSDLEEIYIENILVKIQVIKVII